MRVPNQPPSRESLLELVASNPRRLGEILKVVDSPLISGKYLHWDKVQYKAPPEGLSLEEWWLGIKVHRVGRKIPLLDRGGAPFLFNMADPLAENLHAMDLITGNSQKMPDQVKRSTRGIYLTRSRVEEAFTSSQLEGAATTRAVANELALKKRVPRTPGERMVLNNYHTMQRIIELKGEPLSRELIFEIHRTITEGTFSDPTGTGRFRHPDENIVVGDEYDAVFHTPPDANQLEWRMSALCDFANVADGGPFIHPVIRSIIVHFWLSYDHPFIDGNGRTARALFYWSMLRHDYWLCEYLSISSPILKSPTSYGRAFLHSETDENDLTYFLIYHMEIISRAIEELSESIERSEAKMHDLETDLPGLVGLNERQKELISHVLNHPGSSYTVKLYGSISKVSRPTASNDLDDLVRRRLFRKKRTGKEFSYGPVEYLESILRDGR